MWGFFCVSLVIICFVKKHLFYMKYKQNIGTKIRQPMLYMGVWGHVGKDGTAIECEGMTISAFKDLFIYLFRERVCEQGERQGRGENFKQTPL